MLRLRRDCVQTDHGSRTMGSKPSKSRLTRHGRQTSKPWIWNILISHPHMILQLHRQSFTSNKHLFYPLDFAASTLTHRYHVLTDSPKSNPNRRLWHHHQLSHHQIHPTLSGCVPNTRKAETNSIDWCNSPNRGATAIMSLPERTTPTPTHPSEA